MSLSLYTSIPIGSHWHVAANVEQNRWDIGIGRLPREPPDSHIMQQTKPWQKRNAIITKLAKVAGPDYAKQPK